MVFAVRIQFANSVPLCDEGFHCAKSLPNGRAGAFAPLCAVQPHFARDTLRQIWMRTRCKAAAMHGVRHRTMRRTLGISLGSDRVAARRRVLRERGLVHTSSEWSRVSPHGARIGLRSAPCWNWQAWMLRTAAFAKAIERSAGAAMIVFETH